MESLEELLALPPSELAKIPAGTPPPGVVPDFEHGYTIAPAIIGSTTAFGLIATLFMIIRVYMKVKVVRNWKAEDTLLILSWMSTVVFYVSLLMTCVLGGTGRNEWDYHLDRTFFKGFFFAYWVNNSLSQPQSGLAKVAIILQYLRLFKTKRWMKILIIAGIVAMSLVYSGLSIAYLVLGSPWPGETVATWFGSWHVVYTGYFSIPCGFITVFFDFYTLLLPIPPVLQLQLPTGKKVGILIIFLTGGFACIASIVSLYYRYHLDLTDVSMSVGKIAMWALLEMWIAMIVACAPTVHMFWNRHSKLVWLSNALKSSINRLVDRTSARSSQNSREKARSAEDRHHMVKLSPSMESAQGSTLPISQDHPLERHLHEHESEESIPPIPSSERIRVEHSYAVSRGSGRDDIEAQRGFAF